MKLQERLTKRPNWKHVEVQCLYLIVNPSVYLTEMMIFSVQNENDKRSSMFVHASVTNYIKFCSSRSYLIKWFKMTNASGLNKSIISNVSHYHALIQFVARYTGKFLFRCCKNRPTAQCNVIVDKNMQTCTRRILRCFCGEMRAESEI